MRCVYEYRGPDRSKRPLKINGRKALWLKRMIYGEAGRYCSAEKAAALCWAIVNRWFLWPGARHYVTFIGMMRAFSQPINPRWMTGGDLARKYAKRDAGSARRLARRARICKKTTFPRAIDLAVAEFAEGRIHPPVFLSSIAYPRINNWASLPSTPRKFPHGVDVDGDWFFEEKNTKLGSVVRILQYLV